jgi:hypothetical protein
MDATLSLFLLSLVGLAIFALGYSAGRQHDRTATRARPQRRDI